MHKLHQKYILPCVLMLIPDPWVASDTNYLFVLQDDTQDIIAELRLEISKLRDKIASAPEPNRDDVAKMEVIPCRANYVPPQVFHLMRWAAY